MPTRLRRGQQALRASGTCSSADVSTGTRQHRRRARAASARGSRRWWRCRRQPRVDEPASPPRRTPAAAGRRGDARRGLRRGAGDRRVPHRKRERLGQPDVAGNARKRGVERQDAQRSGGNSHDRKMLAIRRQFVNISRQADREPVRRGRRRWRVAAEAGSTRPGRDPGAGARGTAVLPAPAKVRGSQRQAPPPVASPGGAARRRDGGGAAPVRVVRRTSCRRRVASCRSSSSASSSAATRSTAGSFAAWPRRA